MKYEREATKQRRHVITMAVAATLRNLTHVTAPAVQSDMISRHCTQQTVHLVLLQTTHVQCCCIVMCLHIYVSHESMCSSALLTLLWNLRTSTDVRITFVGGLQQSILWVTASEQACCSLTVCTILVRAVWVVLAM